MNGHSVGAKARGRSSSLFDLPSDRFDKIDKSREQYFLKLEQLNTPTRELDPVSSETPMDDESECIALDQAPVRTASRQIIRPKRSNSFATSSHGFTYDMAVFAHVRGDYDVVGKTERESESPPNSFVPPHKLQHDVGECFSFCD